MLWFVMVMHPMANSSIAAARADVKAVRTRLPMPIQKLAARRSCTQAQERSSLRGLTRTFGVSRTTVSKWIKKNHDSWIWIALCRKTRQVVAYAVGDRSKKTCQRLWEAIPQGYRQGHCFTDFWATYPAVLPKEHHFAVGKE